MAYKIEQPWSSADVWRLVRRQHGVIARRQLLDAGLTQPAILHRVTRGRLHPMERGVYAVGRPELSRDGQMMAAVLACGPEAWISHETGGELLRVRRREPGPMEVSVPVGTTRRRSGIRIHRRALDAFVGQPGVKVVRDLLDGATFLLTDSELERRFLSLVRSAGLSDPQTQRYVSSHRVDFVWPELGLVVETDSLRYHRTPFQQRKDVERDQAHRARGLVPVRFTQYQVRRKREHVLAGLADGARMAEAARDLRRTG